MKGSLGALTAGLCERSSVLRGREARRWVHSSPTFPEERLSSLKGTWANFRRAPRSRSPLALAASTIILAAMGGIVAKSSYIEMLRETTEALRQKREGTHVSSVANTLHTSSPCPFIFQERL